MLKTVVLAENSTDPNTWETVKVEDVCAFLASHFSTFPDTAKIYHGQVSEENDITPTNETEVTRLQNLEGKFYVVVYPAEPISIIVAVGAFVFAAVAFSQKPPSEPIVPEPLTRKQDNTSPNNELSDRQNRARINGRIPDIFGTFRSTPDLIAPNYVVYENHLKTENSLLCTGIGEYEIPVEEIKEDTTSLQQITDTKISVFSPGVNPCSLGTPQLNIGGPFTDGFLSTKRNAAVNGQTLFPELETEIIGSSNIAFGGLWRGNLNHRYAIENNGDYNFRNFIAAGSQVQVENAEYDLLTFDPDSNAVDHSHIRFLKFVPGWPYFGNHFFMYTSSRFFSGVVELIDFVFSVDGTDYDLDGIYTLIGNPSHPSANPPTYVFPSYEDLILINPNWVLFYNTFVLGTPYNFYNVKVREGRKTETIDVSGTYTVESVEEEAIYLFEPDNENPVWNDVLVQYNKETQINLPYTVHNYYQSPTIENITGNTVGPFVIDDPETEAVFVNFGALQGLYKDSGVAQTEIIVEIETTITPIDENGDATGSATVFSTNVVGSEILKSGRYATGQFELSSPSRCKVECTRVTPFVEGFEGNVVEEVKFIDLYGAKKVWELDFGNVTTVRVKARATAEATSAESRQLNMLVTRKIPQRVSGSTFTEELFATNRADEIISFIALDSRLGNRSTDEIDFDNIYQTVADIEKYFDTDIMTEFSHTFDSDNLSFEETINTIASAIFCTAYRRGNQIKLSFEKETDISTLLFNHRNKIPGTEKRSVRFGIQNDNDGIEFEYVDPSDDSIQTIYLPEDQSAINPKKIEMPGIRSKLQAYIMAWRLWNKTRYQNVSVEFEATQEADLLVLGDRILNADNTRPNIQDGQIENQVGLELELSQKVVFEDGVSYLIFIQHTDESVESISITEGSTSYKVVLAQAPKAPIVTDPSFYAKTTYLIVEAVDVGANAFLVNEKNPHSNFTSFISAINYDSRYYDNDKDYENGIVNENGNLV